MSQGNEKLTLEERAVTAVLAPLFLHIVLLVLACLRPARSHALGMAVLPLMMGSDRPLGAALLINSSTRQQFPCGFSWLSSVAAGQAFLVL